MHKFLKWFFVCILLVYTTTEASVGLSHIHNRELSTDLILNEADDASTFVQSIQKTPQNATITGQKTLPALHFSDNNLKKQRNASNQHTLSRLAQHILCQFYNQESVCLLNKAKSQLDGYYLIHLRKLLL